MADLYYIPGAAPAEYVTPGRAFTLGDLQYPPNWLAHASEEDLAAINAKAVEYGPKPDERFYTITEVWDGASVAYRAAPRPLEELKTQLISAAKQVARQHLAATDWVVVRAMEDPTSPAPEDTLAQRAAVRAASNEYEATITACTTVDELSTVGPFVG